MSDPTGKTYKISTVEDFLQVPTDRRAVCLSEFEVWLGLLEVVRLANDAAGMTLAKMESGAFVWMDDGKGEANVTVRDIDDPENFFRKKFKIKPEN